MHILVIINSNDSEVAWNAFRFANTALTKNNRVDVFLLGSGVEAGTISTSQYDVVDQLSTFQDQGGNLLACGACCEKRKESMPLLLEALKCSAGSMQKLYDLVAEADKVLTF